MTNRPAYFDYQATTPVDRAVLDVMLPFYTEAFGNAHSGDHPYALEAAEAIETARRQTAGLIGAQPREIVFTSGATEANNLLIAGTVRAAAKDGRRRVITVETEHKSVLATVLGLRNEGFEVDVLPVDSDGRVDLEQLKSVLDEHTALVSIMAANNEIGVLQPLETIGRLCREAGVVFHTDAAQAAGKVPLDVVALNVDLLSLSAHKMYGPKGIGAAFVSRKSPVRPQPVALGGGQENGLRPGTLPTALCAGLGAASAIAKTKLSTEPARLAGLRDRFLRHLEQAQIDYAINGNMADRLPGNLNVSFTGVDAEALLMVIQTRVAAASGSACTAQSLDPSYVVQALGFGVERAETAVRFGFGRPTTPSEVDGAAAVVVQAVRQLRRVSYAPVSAMSA